MFSSQVQQLHDMEEVCYEKVLEQIRAGHQVMSIYVLKIVFYSLSLSRLFNMYYEWSVCSMTQKRLIPVPL